MKQTDKSKQKIAEALKDLPGNFELSTTRQHLVNALKSLQKYEEKSIFSAVSVQPWQNEIPPIQNNNKEAVMGCISYFDALIDAEKNTLEQIKTEKAQKDSNEVFLS